MRRKVPPTRMELLRIRKRLALAVRGHKLLKDKLEGLIKEVTERLDELKRLRLEVDSEFPEVVELFTRAAALASPVAAETAAATAYPGAVLRTIEQRVMGIPLARFDLAMSADLQPYNLSETSPMLDRHPPPRRRTRTHPSANQRPRVLCHSRPPRDPANHRGKARGVHAQRHQPPHEGQGDAPGPRATCPPHPDPLTTTTDESAG